MGGKSKSRNYATSGASSARSSADQRQFLPTGLHRLPSSGDPKEPAYAPTGKQQYAVVKRHAPASSSSSASKAKEASALDVTALPPPVLRKYRDVYRIRLKKSSREDLATAVARHFANHSAKETESITHFLYAVRNKGKLLKLPPPPNL